MKKVIKLTESDLRRIVRRVIAEQKRAGTNTEVLSSISSMNFAKENCKDVYKRGDIELSFDYCNKTYPNIVISYPQEGLEVLDINPANPKIIKTWEFFSEEDIPDLELTVKNIVK